ncbi:MAG: hypothetical protein M3460_25945 [Actinomycetota bacterium]|nr:hypothetical protein [Actinomycetota bacterium]
MDETLQQPGTSSRDWRVPCYNPTGQATVCVIDSNHGAVRIGVTSGEQEQFFELRAGQADQFRAGLEATLSMINIAKPDKTVRWEGHCYNKWAEPSNCLIETTKHNAVRISCTLLGEQDWRLELRENHIRTFQDALAKAMKVFHADIAIHGQHWADEEADQTEAASPCAMEESIFAQEINKMVAAEAPEVLALVEEIGDRVDAITIAYCLAFPDHVEVISAGPDRIRGSFRSAERARTLLSAGDKAKVRLVSVTEAQKQLKAA